MSTKTKRDPTSLLTSMDWGRGINYAAAGRGFQASVKINEPGYTATAPFISFTDALFNTPVINTAAPPSDVIGAFSRCYLRSLQWCNY
ncbi:hypothetical protein TNIN_157711 [Trichonephila inaurata madagascariensis]|uniref:Uncharacterized protein n=1 Tax=Trichonephila inaurata madagascariensis TaxID=2747483 RepID=A0A8X6IFV7_9ARAC|nr:hypothetical protein TNIN_157711 [Trichonephila inaurata madagascariensis]